MPDAPRRLVTLDLSTGPGTPRTPRARKGPPPLVVKTINLSTPRSRPTPDAAPAPDAADRPTRASAPAPRTATARGRSAPSGGTSLADLLDDATLARLTGSS